MKPILYIEDNFHNRRIVRKILGVHGYSLVEAEDGLTGYEMIQELQPPLVLLDIALPGIDGMEIAKRVKASQQLKHIPLVALTASAMRGDRERFLAAGCDGYLSKPFKADELMDIIVEYYGKDIGERGDLAETVMISREEQQAKIEEIVAQHAAIEKRTSELTAAAVELMPTPVPVDDVARNNGDYGDHHDEGAYDMDADYDERLLKNLSLDIDPPTPDVDIEAVRRHKENEKKTAKERENLFSLLIVDDNVWDARLLRRLFQARAHYSVTVAHNVTQARNAIKAEKPDLILLDLMLPDTSGEDLLSQLRTNPETQDIPVVIVSVKEMETEARDKLLAQADSVWSKEMLDHRKLFEHVEKLLLR